MQPLQDQLLAGLRDHLPGRVDQTARQRAQRTRCDRVFREYFARERLRVGVDR